MLLVDGGWRDRYKTRGIKLWSCLSGREKRGGLGRRPGRRTRIGGKRGRRTWLLLKTTAPSKRSSAAWTRSSTPGVLLGRYPILRILFTRLLDNVNRYQIHVSLNDLFVSLKIIC